MNYGPHSLPQWCRPLALFLTQHGSGPYLDVGCAYGHLVREIQGFSLLHKASGIEWSDWAYNNRVTENVIHDDARYIRAYFKSKSMGTITSLDFLEHFTVRETRRLMSIMARTLRNDGLMVHVFGAKDVEPLHDQDPSHANHRPLTWFIDAFNNVGMRVDEERTAHLQQHPVFIDTGWAKRIVAFTKGVPGR